MADSDASSNQYSPGDVVLAKVKGFSPWPGMIMTENLLTDPVMKAKPKPTAGTKKKKGSKKPPSNDQVWPVRFFIDGSHTWATSSDLKPLSTSAAKTYVDNAKNKRDKMLVLAYKVAITPPGMEDLINGADNELVEEEQEQQSTKQQQSAKTKKSAPTKQKTAASSTRAKPSPSSSTSENKRQRSKQESDNKSNKKAKSDEGDNDNAVGKSKKAKTSSVDDEEEEKSITENPDTEDETPENIKPSFSKLKENYQGREEQITIIRHRLQRGFLGSSKPTESLLPQLSSHMKTLEVNPDLEISIIRKSKVNKVLKQLLKIDDIPMDEVHKFRERSEKLLTLWSSINDGKDTFSTTGTASAIADVKDENGHESAPAEDDTVKKNDDKEANGDVVKKEAAGAEEKNEVSKTEEKADEPLKEEPATVDSSVTAAE